MAFLSSIVSGLITVLFFLSSITAGSSTRAIKPIDSENIRLCMGVISDTHIQVTDARKTMLTQGFKALSDDDIDTVIVSGDMTDHGRCDQYQTFYDCVKNGLKGPEFIPCIGNHDTWADDDESITDDRSPVSVKYFKVLYRNYSGRELENPYFSTEKNGYKIICMSTAADRTDAVIPDEEITWLDSELAAATAEGKPAFVFCHWPINGTNNQSEYWDEGGMGEQSDSVRSVLEKYQNVFFITGHVHAGFNEKSYEKINGVNYVNVPCYMYLNVDGGNPLSGCGYIIEVYDDTVNFRARNIALQYWMPDYDFEVTLSNAIAPVS